MKFGVNLQNCEEMGPKVKDLESLRCKFEFLKIQKPQIGTRHVGSSEPLSFFPFSLPVLFLFPRHLFFFLSTFNLAQGCSLLSVALSPVRTGGTDLDGLETSASVLVSSQSSSNALEATDGGHELQEALSLVWPTISPYLEPLAAP